MKAGFLAISINLTFTFKDQVPVRVPPDGDGSQGEVDSGHGKFGGSASRVQPNKALAHIATRQADQFENSVFARFEMYIFLINKSKIKLLIRTINTKQNIYSLYKKCF